MNELRTDLSLLEPFPDPLDFDRATAALTAEILTARARSWSLWQGLYRRARLAAVLAAAAAAVVLALQFALPPARTLAVELPPREAIWANWTASDHEPSTAEILETFVTGGTP